MLLNSKFYNIPEEKESKKLPSDARLIIYSKNLTTDENVFLSKVLQATKLPDSAVMRINAETEFFPVKHIISADTSMKVLNFDCDNTLLGLQAKISKYKSLHLGQTEIVCMDDLQSISQETHLKKFLWTSLKKWFIDA